jgi:hypothetical protein
MSSQKKQEKEKADLYHVGAPAHRFKRAPKVRAA